MNGVLLVDKPAGPTSHDVVARLRRVTGERSVGHTGTLDPRATGLLPLVLGRATRLASLLTGSDKTYDATIRLGWATDTDDAEGAILGPRTEPGTLPETAVVATALEAFRGEVQQQPPTHSAKKIRGQRAYDLARRERPVDLPAVQVTVHALELLDRAEDLVRVQVRVSAGFYVRALARDLGHALGCGGHLEALRRTHSGRFSVTDAVTLDEAERLGPDLAARLIAPAEAVSWLVSVEVTEHGLKRVRHGNSVGPEHLAGRWVPPPATAEPVRVLAADGELVALARPRGGFLHPVVVLGYH